MSRDKHIYKPVNEKALDRHMYMSCTIGH
jgi:hypothetical protein